jgi:DNA-binding MarR family transcriptional regulator
VAVGEMFDQPEFAGYWLTRVAEIVRRQGNVFLGQQNIQIPSQSVSTVLFIAKNKGESISDVSRALGISHQLATQRVQALVELSYVRFEKDTRDQRRKILLLTEQGRAQLKLLEKAFEVANKAFLKLEEELGFDIVDIAKKTEKALIRKSIKERTGELETEVI